MEESCWYGPSDKDLLEVAVVKRDAASQTVGEDSLLGKVSSQAEKSQPATAFGPFRLYPSRRLLLRNDTPVRIGSRSFDILAVLVQRAGEIVSTEELISRVWPESVVADNNVRVHVATLRKALNDGIAEQRFIENIPLKGYVFVAPVMRLSDEEAGSLARSASHGHTEPQLSAKTPRLLGRDAAMQALRRLIDSRRLVTIVGPAGIGKTVLAQRLGAVVASEFPDGVYFADLGLIDDPDLVPGVVASTVGVSLRADDPLLGLAESLRSKRALLLLDSCDHVLTAAASLAERLLRHAPTLTILSTSREPLLAESEFVQRLTPLDLPLHGAPLTVEEALASSAVQLFVERATASVNEFVADATTIVPIVEICRRLDGIPLAIELAASRVHAFGVGDLSTRLNDRLSLTMRGRRTALPRHQTLGAAVDWSYVALGAEEQQAMRRLAVFRGSFSMEAAVAVVGVLDDSPGSATNALPALVLKSLVQLEVSKGDATYRELATTRSYAAQKLEEAGEASVTRSRHAAYLANLFDALSKEWASIPPNSVALDHGAKIADIRTALDWSFSSEGTAEVGARLLATSATLWFALSLMDEFRAWAKVALSFAARDSLNLPIVEMRLQIAYGHALWHSMSDLDAMGLAFERAKQLAQEHANVEVQLDAIWGLWLVQTVRGEYESAVSLTEEFGVLADWTRRSGCGTTLFRMQSLAFHLSGQQSLARSRAEHLQQHGESENTAARNSGFQFDKTVSSLATLSRILWLQGFPEQALKHADGAVQAALTADHDLSLCYALAHGAIPVALWCGEYATARRYTSMLVQRAAAGSFEFWAGFGRAYSLALDLDPQAPEAIAEWYSQWLSRGSISIPLIETLSTVNAVLAADASLRRAESHPETWCAPELLRVQAQRVIKQDGLDAFSEAEALLVRSIALAQAQGALSWELRSVISLSRLRLEYRADQNPLACLAETYARFDEGFSTRDLVDAASLLSQEPRYGVSVRSSVEPGLAVRVHLPASAMTGSAD